RPDLSRLAKPPGARPSATRALAPPLVSPLPHPIEERMRWSSLCVVEPYHGGKVSLLPEWLGEAGIDQRALPHPGLGEEDDEPLRQHQTEQGSSLVVPSEKGLAVQVDILVGSGSLVALFPAFG